MIVNMKDGATEQQIEHVIERVREAGYQAHVTRGEQRTIVAAVGSGRRVHRPPPLLPGQPGQVVKTKA